MNSESVSYANASQPANANVINAPVSAVSWGAILAGAAGAASLSLILLMLGTGLGLSSISPWLNSGIDAKTLGVSTIVWVIFTQLAAAALGGYIAGRMRTRWRNVPVDEVYFRDTAHGFLTWSVATLFTAALLTSTISAVLSGVSSTTVTALSSSLEKPARRGVEGLANAEIHYQLDKLFRTSASVAIEASAPNPNDASVAMPQPYKAPRMSERYNKRAFAEVRRIFSHARARGETSNSALSPDDLSYVAAIVARQAGLSISDAEARVTASYAATLAKAAEFEAQAKAVADKARKTAAHTSLWLFISLLIGAFIASLSATIGAKHRDD